MNKLILVLLMSVPMLAQTPAKVPQLTEKQRTEIVKASRKHQDAVRKHTLAIQQADKDYYNTVVKVAREAADLDKYALDLNTLTFIPAEKPVKK